MGKREGEKDKKREVAQEYILHVQWTHAGETSFRIFAWGNLAMLGYFVILMLTLTLKVV